MLTFSFMHLKNLSFEMARFSENFVALRNFEYLWNFSFIFGTRFKRFKFIFAMILSVDSVLQFDIEEILVSIDVFFFKQKSYLQGLVAVLGLHGFSSFLIDSVLLM